MTINFDLGLSLAFSIIGTIYLVIKMNIKNKPSYWSTRVKYKRSNNT